MWTVGMAEQAPMVSIRSRETVVPATPTHKHHLFLSCFDMMWIKLNYNERLIFYEGALFGQADAADAPAAVMAKLKSSLALCLVHYYPWCGRLVHGQPPNIRPFIDCNAAGVEFVEASVDLPISQLSSRGFQMHPSLFEKLRQHVDPVAQDSPLLSIQATLFSDGGLALGISASHVVADGQALWNFMVSWGECSREVPLSLPPLLNREVLAVPNPSPEKATWKLHATMNEEEPHDQPSMGTDPSTVDSSMGTDASAGTPSLVQFLLIVPLAAIKQLKNEDGGVHTSYEVMCAHIWKHVSLARQRPSHEPTYFFVLADCRSRVKPPLPSSYFGNAIAFDMTVSTIGKICGESLHATACRIHETVVAIAQDSLVGFMHWNELPGNDPRSAALAQMVKGTGLHVASSPRFPAYDVDFGWGKPCAVRIPKTGGEGQIVFFGGNPNLDTGDVEICTCLPEDVLKRLLQNPTFLGKVPHSPVA